MAPRSLYHNLIIVNRKTQSERLAFNQHPLAPTGILPPFVPVDEAGDQHDESEQRDGAHQADEPALGGYSFVDAGET